MNTKKLIGTILGVILFAALIAGATFAWLSGDVTINNTQILDAQITNFVIDYKTGSHITKLPIVDSTKAKAGTVTATNGGTLSGAEVPVTAIVIKRNGTATTIPDGHAAIWLNTETDNQLTKDSVVRWAVCRVDGEVTTDTACGGLASFEQSYYSDYPTNTTINTNSPVLNMGTITAKGVIPLLSDARLADSATNRGSAVTANCTAGSTESTTTPSMCTGTNKNTKMLAASGTTYFVYFWLDGENITNNHLKDQYEGGDTSGEIKFDLYRGYVFATATQLQQ